MERAVVAILSSRLGNLGKASSCDSRFCVDVDNLEDTEDTLVKWDDFLVIDVGMGKGKGGATGLVEVRAGNSFSLESGCIGRLREIEGNEEPTGARDGNKSSDITKETGVPSLSAILTTGSGFEMEAWSALNGSTKSLCRVRDRCPPL